MQINYDIWGAYNNWNVDTDLSNAAWYDVNLQWFNGQYPTLASMIEHDKAAYNTPLDDSICYAAHSHQERMPLADIGLYDYQGTKRGNQTLTNGFFFASQNYISSGQWDRFELLSKWDDSTQAALAGAYRWKPNAIPYSETYPRPTNLHRYLKPIVQFAPKSFFGVIMVDLVSNDHTSKTTITLKALETNIDTYKNTHYIAKAYMNIYGYQGRVSAGGNFNNFAIIQPNNFGVSCINPYIVNTHQILTYYQTLGGLGQIPIAGAIGSIHDVDISSNSNFGVDTQPYYEDAGGGSESWQAVCSDHLINNITVSHITGNTYCLHTIININADIIEKIRKGAAAYGIFFADTTTGLITDTTNTNRWTHENMCLGLLDESGIGHGEYTRGSNNTNNPIFDYTSSQDSPYKPDVPIDPNTYSNTTGFNSLSSSAAMTRRYVLNAANVEKLGDDLWTICNDLATGGDFEYFDGKLKDEFLTTNPIDSIVSLQRFPFSIPHTFAPTKTAVRLGKTDGSAQGYLTNNPFNTIVFQGIDIFARFGNCFLDYEPFTSYELYVPFCGTTKIRAADVIGHKLNLTMQIDLMTGNCTAYIMADQLVIETLNGSCGVDMQLSGIQSATVAANLYNGILGQQQAKTNMIAQGASALLPSSWVNPVGYAAKGEQAETTYKQATYAIEHTETPVHSIGSASALLAWVQEFDARLIIYYPEGDVINSAIPPSYRNSALAAFGHLKGFATVDPGMVSNYQISSKAAYLQGDILAESISCTQSERNKIKAFFADGVYLPPIS